MSVWVFIIWIHCMSTEHLFMALNRNFRLNTVFGLNIPPDHHFLWSDLLLMLLYHHIHPSYLSLISHVRPRGRPALRNRNSPSIMAEEIPLDTHFCANRLKSEAGCLEICIIYTIAAWMQHCHTCSWQANRWFIHPLSFPPSSSILLQPDSLLLRQHFLCPECDIQWRRPKDIETNRE